jgi:hypothetical protein
MPRGAFLVTADSRRRLLIPRWIRQLRGVLGKDPRVGGSHTSILPADSHANRRALAEPACRPLRSPVGNAGFTPDQPHSSMDGSQGTGSCLYRRDLPCDAGVFDSKNSWISRPLDPRHSAGTRRRSATWTSNQCGGKRAVHLYQKNGPWEFVLTDYRFIPGTKIKDGVQLVTASRTIKGNPLESSSRKSINPFAVFSKSNAASGTGSRPSWTKPMLLSDVVPTTN